MDLEESLELQALARMIANIAREPKNNRGEVENVFVMLWLIPRLILTSVSVNENRTDVGMANHQCVSSVIC